MVIFSLLYLNFDFDSLGTFSFVCFLFLLFGTAKKQPNKCFQLQAPIRERYGIDITPLTYIPGGRIDKYLGNLNFFFIRESTSIRENGGISGFVHSFITEVCFGVVVVKRYWSL